MANADYLEILRSGVKKWNDWRTETLVVRPDLSGADLDRAHLRQANLADSNLWGASMVGADLREADLSDADLRGADLRSADFRGANLRNANLIRAVFSDAESRDIEFFDEEGTDVQSEFAGFSATELLNNVSLNGANFCSANLSGTIFEAGADLRGTNFSQARLIGTDFSFLDLCGIDFSGADLGGANFSYAELAGVDLRNAIAFSTQFANCDLSEVKGLELVRHWGPSSVGIDTIYESGCAIPENFLRGCGVPEGFITQMPWLIGAEEGIQFYSCFISYSTKDKEFADCLYARMQEAHLRVWYAPQDLQGGKKTHEQIDTAIRVSDKLLLVLSEASLHSEWVISELRMARKAERQTARRKLFPVLLVDFETLRNWECFDSDSGKDLAVELREYFIPDFSNWKDHDQFEAAFARLLNDLRADELAK